MVGIDRALGSIAELPARNARRFRSRSHPQKCRGSLLKER